jgi:C4-dicarboxylate-binding protein DctP
MRNAFNRLIVVAMLVASVPVFGEPIEIQSGNVIGSPVAGEMPHHMLLTQKDLATLVGQRTGGSVAIEILEGKREDIPVFRMPAMTVEGHTIQATAVPSFFLPKVPELQIFEIPYLFRDRDHAARYPGSPAAQQFSQLIEARYGVKVIGHFLVAHHVAITSTDRPVILPEDFTGRHVNDDFESFAPMWQNIKPAMRYQIGYNEAVAGALHDIAQLDTSIGMLQNLYAQKQYTKFRFATIAPGFYTFFYTFIVNRETWESLDSTQQAGMLSAAQQMQQTAFDNEQATAIYHTALNRSLGVSIHEQTAAERAAWRTEFSDKVRDGILAGLDDPDELRAYIRAIREL